MVKISNISYEAGFIIGFITVIGLVLKKESKLHIMESFVKVMIGYSILVIGSELATKQLSEIAVLVEDVFSVPGIIPNNELIATMAQWFYGKKLIYIMIVGMVIHLIIARFTKFKHVFLTGHHILFMAALITGVLSGTALPIYIQVLIGSVILAILLSFLPILTQPLMDEVYPNQKIGLAHFGNIGFFIAGKIAMLFKKSKKATLENEPQKPVRLISDPHVLILVFMFSFILFLFTFSGRDLHDNHIFENFYQGINYSFRSALFFTTGIYIIIMGVRMMLHELLHSFQIIAEKLIPNAIPSLDSPIVFPFAPQAVVLGFFSSMVGGVVAMLVLAVSNITVVLPAAVAHFFSGGTSGVFGYKMGGYKGAIVGAFVHGLLISFLPLLLIPVMHDLGYTHTTFSETDFGVIGYVLYKLIHLFQ